MKPALRIAIASLSLSAAGMGTLVVDESYRSTAYIPVAGDRWTLGFGSTFWEDGTPVKQGDTITPVRAITLKLTHIAVDEEAVKKCVTAPLTQGEYDILLSHAYQYGHAATCSSTLVKLINEKRYGEACQQYSRWTKVGKRECRDPANGCVGVATRADARAKQCLIAGQNATAYPEAIVETIHEPIPFTVEFPTEVKEEPKPTRIWPWILLLTALVGAAAFYIRKSKHAE